MTHIRSSKVFVALGLAALASVVGCDARSPTAPPSPALLPRAKAPDALLGSRSLAPQSEFGPVATLPANRWVIVRVSGAWQATANPACGSQPPEWPCIFNPAYSGFGPDFPDAFAGPVYLRTLHDGSWDPLPMRGISATDGVALTRREFDRELYAGPGPFNNPSVQQYGNTGSSVHSWLITGNYAVTVTKVESPIRLTESPAGADGSRTYTVEPLYGLALLNGYAYNAPPGAVEWEFIPGDSVSDEPADGANGEYVWECRYQTTCTYTPKGAGRMQVVASVETQRVRARSQRGGEEPTFELTCNMRKDSVTLERGSNIDCRATAAPQGGRTLWSFAADSFPYQNPAPGATQHQGQGWSGKMVLSGTITAKTTILAQSYEAKLHVRVEPRQWAGKRFPESVQETRADSEFRARPDSMQNLGHTHNQPTLTIERSDWEAILDGPNANLAFFVEVPVRYDGIIHINYLALSEGSDFWKAQPPQRPNVKPGEPILCGRSDVLPVIPLIRKHEGVGQDPASHVYLYLQQARLEFGPAAEPIVGTDVANLMDRLRAAIGPAASRADSASRIADTKGYAPVYCRFNYTYPPRETN